MKRRSRLRLPREPRQVFLLAGGGVALAAVAAIGFAVGAKSFSAARASARAKLASDHGRLQQIAKAESDRERLKRDLQGVFERTLGPDPATADAELRSRLNRIGEDIRLSDLRVSTGTATSRTSPAKRAFPKSKDPRYLEDFIELPATVTGTGTLEQALALVHRIDVEPWIKRIDGVTLDEEKDGERIKVVVRLTTIFVPDHKGNAGLRPSESDVALFERVRGVVQANPFRVPAPPAAAPTPVAEAPSSPLPPPGFPYDQWRVTALVTGPLGPEAWLRNATTSEQRQLTPGQAIGDARFVGFANDIAEFALGDARFRVQVGGSLNERLPGSQS